MIEFSVAVCTHNRARLLERALESLLSQTLSPGLFEVLVVDNASQDETPALVRRYQSRRPDVFYEHEPVLGIARARNRALQRARGRYIAFLDDDAVATPRWLEIHLRALEAGYQAAAGRVELEWREERPAWLLPEYDSLYARYYFGEEDMDLPRDAYLVTTNASFSLKLLRAMGGFDERLGHRGRLLVGGEDGDLFRRLCERGLQVRYLAGALVRHSLDPRRLTRRWLLRRMLWDGMGIASLDFRDSRPTLRRLFYDVRKALGHSLLALGRIRRRPRWRAIYVALQHWGRFLGGLSLYLRRPP